MTDQTLYAAEGIALTFLLGGAEVLILARYLRRRRPELDLVVPLMLAFVVRVIAAAALGGLTSVGNSIRGADELLYMADAHALAGLPLSSGSWVHTLLGHFNVGGAGSSFSGSLHVFLMALQIKLFNASEMAMRITMAAISVTGLGLIAAAVYELAGRRPARLTAWILVFEPANVFYSTALHKEPTLFLALGLVTYGGALMWRRPRVVALVLMVTGCLVATATRPYAGWFLGAACTLTLLHAALRSTSSRTTWAVALVVLVAGAAIVSTPAIVNATSKQELTRELQGSQTANANDNSNLHLSETNFSSRGAILKNIWGRMFDLLVRPFPWQLGDTAQKLGVIETLFVLAALAVVIQLIVRRARDLLPLAGPFIYPAFMLLVAYSLAVGNAGTGFRYRAQIVPLIIALALVLRERAPARMGIRSRRDRPVPATVAITRA